MVAEKRYEIEIERNGTWPLYWSWTVWERWDYHSRLRTGEATTKERAFRKAVKAKLSMQHDDLDLVDPS